MRDHHGTVIIVADDQEVGERLHERLRLEHYAVRLDTLPGGPAGALTGGPVGPADVLLVSLREPNAAWTSWVAQQAERLLRPPILVVPAGVPLPEAIALLGARLRVVHGGDETRLLATLAAAVQPRDAQPYDRRVVWELQIINRIAAVLARSLDIRDVLAGALQCLVPALGAASGSVRLRNELTGRLDVVAVVGGPELRAMWRPPLSVPRPSDRAVETRAAVIVEDFAEAYAWLNPAELPLRSAISLPLLASDELLGTLSLGASTPGRFDLLDERFLTTVAGQVAVAAQNARLHAWVRRGKREWEQTFDAISDPIAVFNSAGRLLRGNVALAAAIDRPVTGLAQATCAELGFCGGNCPACAVGVALREATPVRTEVTRGDGQIFSVTTFPVSGGGEGPSVVQVAKNVTEEIRSARRLQQMSEELARANERLTTTVDQLKSTQAQLLQAEKLSAIGQLVAGVAHELNNPLTSVIGYAQLLQEEVLEGRADVPRPPGMVTQDLRRIVDEAERAAKIVRNLLAFARRQTAARAAHDLSELAARVLSLRSYELRLNSIALRTEFTPDLPQVIADGSQIQQALLNLILNAEQAMRDRPHRMLTVRAVHDADAAAVAVSVTDTGHGIHPGDLGRVFDPFFTTREVGVGTGLGLSICYGIVRDHGGQILVDTQVDQGTTFTLLMPARTREERAGGPPVLVTHTDPGERDFVTAMLQGWGIRTEAAGDGVHAIARCRTGQLRAVIADAGTVAADLDEWAALRDDGQPAVPLLLLAPPGESDPLAACGQQATAILRSPLQLRALRAAILDISKEYV